MDYHALYGTDPYRRTGRARPKQDYRTQKAQGVHELADGKFPAICLGTTDDFSSYGFLSVPPPFKVVTKKKDLSIVVIEYPTFARPCPVIPRHGFVDSRVVNNLEELTKVWDETVDVDPQGEVIAMRPCTGLFSGIATNAGVTWGWENDGVTSFSKGQVFIPAPVALAYWQSLAKNSSYNYEATGEAPYIEMVEDNGQVRAVQCRAGPPQVTAMNFVPNTWKVKKVFQITPEYEKDLVEWENHIYDLIRENKHSPNGLCFHFPQGTLASHFAVHCIAKGIPVVCTYPVKVGDTLEPEGAAPPLTKKELAKLAELLTAWREKNYIQKSGGPSDLDKKTFKPGETLKAALATLHSCSAWDGSLPLLTLRAAAAVTMARFMAAATMGEARHFFMNGPGRGASKICPVCDGDGSTYDEDTEDSETCSECEGEGEVTDAKYGIKPHVSWKEITLTGEDWKVGDRSFIYNRVLTEVIPIDQVTQWVDAAMQDFSMPGWRGANDEGEGASYGGKSWANVAKSTLELIWATNNFIETPNRKNWEAVYEWLNTAAYVTHNGGRVGNKWISQGKMDVIAAAPVAGFCSTFVATTVLDAQKAADNE